MFAVGSYALVIDQGARSGLRYQDSRPQLRSACLDGAPLSLLCRRVRGDAVQSDDDGFHAKLLFFDLNNGTLSSTASEVLNLTRNPKPQTLNNYPLTHFLLTMTSPSPAKPKTAHTAPANEQVWQESTYFNPKLNQLQYYNPKP